MKALRKLASEFVALSSAERQRLPKGVLLCASIAVLEECGGAVHGAVVGDDNLVALSASTSPEEAAALWDAGWTGSDLCWGW